MDSALYMYVRIFSLNIIRDLIGNQCSDLSRGLKTPKAYLTWSPLGKINCVHAANLFYIFRNNRTANNYSSQGDCLLEYRLEKLQ